MKSICILILFISFSVISQNTHPHVTLKEHLMGKRLQIIAVNTDTISYDVFLKVNTDDYRRSSLRPIIKTLPPKSETTLITMIKLNDKEGTYNTTFIVNEVRLDLKMRKDYENLNLKIDKALKINEISIFTKNDCSLCDDLKTVLVDNGLKFEEYNITNHANNLEKLSEALKNNGTSLNVTIPVVKINNSIYTEIKSKTDLIEALRKEL